ncbi:MAG: hypothetical protein AB1758_19670, partial [Candidatus Eremiobacterota bacterium]
MADNGGTVAVFLPLLEIALGPDGKQVHTQPTWLTPTAGEHRVPVRVKLLRLPVPLTRATVRVSVRSVHQEGIPPGQKGEPLEDPFFPLDPQDDPVRAMYQGETLSLAGHHHGGERPLGRFTQNELTTFEVGLEVGESLSTEYIPAEFSGDVFISATLVGASEVAGSAPALKKLLVRVPGLIKMTPEF